MTGAPTKEQSDHTLIERASIDNINNKLTKEKKYYFIVHLVWRWNKWRPIEVVERIEIGPNYKRLRMIVFPFQLQSKLFIVCRGFIFSYDSSDEPQQHHIYKITIINENNRRIRRTFCRTKKKHRFDVQQKKAKRTKNLFNWNREQIYDFINTKHGGNVQRKNMRLLLNMVKAINNLFHGLCEEMGTQRIIFFLSFFFYLFISLWLRVTQPSGCCARWWRAGAKTECE